MKPHVLVPIDFSEASERALAWAAALVRALSGELLLFHVVPISPVAAGMPAPWIEPAPEHLQGLRVRLTELAASHGVPDAATRVVVLEDVGIGVVHGAREASCDLIVMSTHGRGGLKRAMLGSVADFVSRQADCPVVTMRGYDKKE